MRIALLSEDGSRVTNVVVGDPTLFPGGVALGESDLVSPGDLHDNGQFARPPVAASPTPLDEAALIDLCQSAGGMTDAQLVSVYTDPQLAAFIIKIKAARQILPTDARTVQGLGALEALGYLPDGADAVLAAWPTA